MLSDTERFNDSFVAKFLPNLSVTEFWKFLTV